MLAVTPQSYSALTALVNIFGDEVQFSAGVLREFHEDAERLAAAQRRTPSGCPSPVR
jgi:hypothetical protein